MNINKISPKAIIGKNVTIGFNTIVHENVIIKDNSIVGSNCELGITNNFIENNLLAIGENSHIRSNSVFYAGSEFGRSLNTGHSVLVRENVKAGNNFQIGTNVDIEGDAEFGDYVSLHSSVQISKFSKIGNFVWIYPNVQFTNDPLPPSNVVLPIQIKDMAVICTGSIILPGVSIGIGCFVGAGSLVNKSVPDVYCVKGNPAEIFSRVDQLVNIEHKLFYPWPKHFSKKYSKESHPLMENIVKKIEDIIKSEKNI